MVYSHLEHGRVLFAQILYNQWPLRLPAAAAAACGASETYQGNLRDPRVAGGSGRVCGALVLSDGGVRLSGGFVWMLGARSGDCVRAIPLTVM